MEQFDKMLKAMAEKEECIVPEGFDRRMQDVLGDLPPRGKKRGLGAVKTALIAAAVCALLMGTAFAASPGLRELLADALGGFAPYAHEQENQTYVVNEFEYRVLSAVSDGTTVQVYVQQRDLVEGRNSTEDMDGILHQNGSSYVDRICIDRDESTGMSLWRLTSWGRVTGESGELSLFVCGFTRETAPEIGQGTFIPLELELMPSIVIAEETQSDQLPFSVEEIRLSPLGVTVVTRDNPHIYNSELSASVRVCLLDGTEIRPEGERTSGQGTYGDWEDPDSQRKVIVWNFRDAVDLDQVAGLWIGSYYFPVE